MEVVGGQAIVEGVMMITQKKIAMAVRKPSGKIIAKTSPRKMHPSLRAIPLVRGVMALGEMLTLGTKALRWSTNQTLKKEEQLSGIGMTLTLAVSFLMGVGLFVALPLWLAHLIAVNSILVNLIDGIFRVIIFLLYVLIIAQMRDVRRLFEYHGAEHMAVHCYEAKKPLDAKHIRRFSALHPRCGTAFLFLVLALSILIFSFIWSGQWIIRFLLRIALIPFVAGISYEILRLSARRQDNVMFRIIIAPGLWFQKITTREPDKRQIEVAAAALKRAL